MRCGLMSLSKYSSHLFLLLLFQALISVIAGAQEERVARIFTDHMVLQRDQPMPVWGWAEPGQPISVSCAGQKVLTKTDDQGSWRVELKALPLTEKALTLTVVGTKTYTFTDVLVGDVWLCSGQSNMGYPLNLCKAADDIRTADFPLIRFTRCGENFSSHLEKDLVSAAWSRLSPGSAGGIGAVPFYFGRRIHQETGIPIGLLHCEVGGTDIESWMPPAAIRDYPANAAVAKYLDNAVANYKNKLPAAIAEMEAWLPLAKQALAAGEAVPRPPYFPLHPNEDRGPHGTWVRTQSLYNGMVHPLVGFPVRGVIWYQGENNGREQQSYFDKKRALIETWRKLWGQNFPFYYVQLANWLDPVDDPAGGDKYGWQNCRMAQLQCLSIPKTGMVVTIDVGEQHDIHPKNKFDVGERLALWALANEYGKTDIVTSGPLYQKMTIEGNTAIIHFTSVGKGLMIGSKQGRAPVVEARDDKLQRFAIAGKDRKWFWATAVIDGQSVKVTAPEVSSPVAVRYAYSNNPSGCNLYNRDGLPASPFRTDDW